MRSRHFAEAKKMVTNQSAAATFEKREEESESESLEVAQV